MNATPFARAGSPLPLSLAAGFALAFAVVPADARPRRLPPEIKVPELIREQLMVVTDNKGHYLVVPTKAAVDANYRSVRTHLYYGHRKTVYLVGGTPARRKDKAYLRVFVQDPRTTSSYLRVESDGAAYYVCEKGRKTPMHVVSGPTGQAILAKMTFRDRFWNRVPHLLARDEDGVYYYVDRQYHSGRAHLAALSGFRFWMGRRGRMKRLLLKDVVVDQAGQIFLTKIGSLHGSGRFRLSKLYWRKGNQRFSLTQVPLGERTFRLIYMHLGPYVGKKIGRPCDDL